MEGHKTQPKSTRPLSLDKFGGYRTEVKGRIEIRERLPPGNKAKYEKHLRDMRGG